MEDLSEEKILSLLDSGWIYVNYTDPYFDESFIKLIDEKDKIRYGNSWFIKKSETLYNRLVTIGMDKGSAAYDSCIIIRFRKTLSNISINMYSLSPSDAFQLKDVASKIKTFVSTKKDKKSW